jgi:hypothetical protein
MTIIMQGDRTEIEWVADSAELSEAFEKAALSGFGWAWRVLCLVCASFRDQPREIASQPALQIRNARAVSESEPIRSPCPQLVRVLDLSKARRIRRSAKVTGSGSSKHLTTAFSIGIWTIGVGR